MNILVINGSPKKESNTLALTLQFLNGINKEHKHNIEIINVIDENINYCQGCLTCWIKQDGSCVIQDGMSDILYKIAQSDMLIWSFPLYEYGIPGHLKTLIDRTNPFLKMEMYSKDNRVFHETVVDITGKKNVVICGCGFPYFENNFVPLKLQLKNILVSPTIICIYESGLISIQDPKLQPKKEKLFEDLKEAGIEYNKTGMISEELLKTIEKPMLPNDVYINIINSIRKIGNLL